MHKILEKIYAQNDLTTQESCQIFTDIISGKVDPILISAFLVGLKIKNESPDEIVGAIQAQLPKSVPFPKTHEIIADITGTGGDLANTFNISTVSAITLASLGIKIAKHGNKKVSSLMGSADLLESLGVNIMLTPENSYQLLNKINICFLFAPNYHPAIKHAMPVRNQLKTRTIFNLTGPFINPSRPDYKVIGVPKKEYVHPLAKVLQKLNYKKSIIVYGSGLDEFTIHDENHFALLENGEIKVHTFTNQDLNFEKYYPLSSIQVKDFEESKLTALNVLKGQGTEAQNLVVSLNAAAILLLFNQCNSLSEGIIQINQHLKTGLPYQKLEEFAYYSNQFNA